VLPHPLCEQAPFSPTDMHAGNVQEAVYSAREDAGHKGWFELDSPATPERLRMACADDLTAPFAPPAFRPKISC